MVFMFLLETLNKDNKFRFQRFLSAYLIITMVIVVMNIVIAYVNHKPTDLIRMIVYMNILITLYAIRKKIRNSMSTALIVFIPSSILMLFGYNTMGHMAMIWSYPFIILIFFFFSNRLSTVIGAVFALINVGLIVYVLLPATNNNQLILLTFRYFSSICAEIALLYLLLNHYQKKIDLFYERIVRDPVTKLYDRWSFFEWSEKKIQVQQKESKNGLIMIQIENFKELNKKIGHRAADTILITLANIIRDLVPEGGEAFRLGSRLFGVILPGKIHTECNRISKEIEAQVKQTLFYPKEKINIITVSAQSNEGDTAESLYEKTHDLLFDKSK